MFKYQTSRVMLLVQVYPSLDIFREQPLYALCQLWELIMPDQKLTEMEKDQEIQSGANWCERTGFKMWTAKTTCDRSGRSPKPKRNTSSLSRNKFFASPGRDSYVTFSFSWFSFSKAALFTGWTVVYKESDKYHFFLIGLNRRNTSLSVGSQRLRPVTKVYYFGDSKPLRKSSIH